MATAINYNAFYSDYNAIASCLQQNSPYNNSTGVYLQAAGSEGLQGIVPGIHLRWAFTDELGYYHLPKGDYFNGSSAPLIAYNQKNDFVRVYRTAYQPGTPLHLDLYAAIPVVDFQQKSWLYTINITGGQQPRTDYIRFIFEDRAAYDLLSRQMNLGTGAISRFGTFINAYPGVLRIQVIGATCYRISAQVSNPSSTTQPIKLESISGMDVMAAYDIKNDFASYQTALIPAEDNEHIVLTAENIKYIRLKKAALLELETLELETYATLLEPIDPQDWEEIGSGFSLTTDDNTAFDRLESTGKSIDNLWPYFNNGTRVRASNYRDKWSKDTQEAPSLRSLISSFLSLSAMDPRAEEFYALEPHISGEIPEGMTVYNLDMINLMSTDYHFARMLGLGYIDNDLPVQNEHYIYQLRYSNKKSIDSGEIVNYTYTSLPTSMADTRLPQKPSMRPLTYTFSDTKSSLNDMLNEHGYSSIDPMRAVNIGRQKEYTEQQGSSFFVDMNSVVNHNIFLSAKPVSYGIAYRKSTDIHYAKPEITTYTIDPDETRYYAYDDDYPQGVLEPVPVHDSPQSLYVHFVWENGFHHYSIYAIDWFFRASERSEEKHTDKTTIIPIARLEPPTNICVQYIQPEESLVFTTGIEQSWIQGRLQQFPGQDVGLTRVTFDWKDIVDVSFVDTASPAELADVARADQALAFFLDRRPIELAGRIVRVSAVTGDSRLARLHTGPYTLIDGTTVAPLLEPQDYARFVGSILTTQDEIYRVQHIQNGLQGPDIIVEKRLVENVVSDEIIDILKGVERLRIAPEAGQRFTLGENLGETTNWSPLFSTVALHSFADAQDPEIEILVDPEGNETRFWIGGITRQATVVPLWNDGGPPGFYQVTLENYTLPPHPQSNIPYDENNPNANAPGALRTPHVEWYKGRIRMPLSADPAGEMKEVEVLRIESLDPVELYIMDPDYATSPIYIPAKVQERVKVNFHPGYRAYFFTEPNPGLFNREHIEPTATENDRKTLLAFQSRDTSISSKLCTLSMPTTLLALYLQEPQAIEMPYISTNRVRPDATRQASFTFDIKVDPDAGGQSRSPFGFMFHRTDYGKVFKNNLDGL